MATILTGGICIIAAGVGVAGLGYGAIDFYYENNGHDAPNF
jgi:hypothetical protein